jgi:excisionase family DNA binding protein
MASYAADWSQPTAEWVSLQQAALIYGISVDTLRRRIAAGELPASRIGARIIRVRIEDLDRVCRPIAVDERAARRRRPW